MRLSDRGDESGYTLVGLMVVVAVINVSLAVAVTSTRTLGSRAREAELLWRGQQIARAIGCYEQANNGQPLIRLEQLVEANCLRRVFRDPMVRDGQWRVLRQQDVADGTVAALLADEVGDGNSPADGSGGIGLTAQSSAAGGLGNSSGAAAGLGATSMTLGQQRPGVTSGSVAGRLPGRSSTLTAGSRGADDNRIVGIVSSSGEDSLRVFGGKAKYSQWVFLGGQAAAAGAMMGPGAIGAAGGSPPVPPRMGLTSRR